MIQGRLDSQAPSLDGQAFSVTIQISALAAADECIRVGIAPNDRLSASMIKAIATVLLGRPRDGLAQLDALIPELERLGSTYLIQLAPRGVALAMLGQISDGIRVVKQQIARCDRIGDQSPGAFAQIILAEIYIQILSGKDKPPASVLLKNFWAILYAMVFGARRARTLLQEAARVNQLSERGVLIARINFNLGVLSAMKKKRDEARSYFTKARVGAEGQRAAPRPDNAEERSQLLRWRRGSPQNLGRDAGQAG